MNFDTLLTDHVGGFGRFQVSMISILCLDEFFAAFHIMGVVFLAAKPEHWCRNDQFDSIDSLTNCTLEEKLNLTVPWIDGKFDSCLMYDRNLTSIDGSGLTCSSAVNLAQDLGNRTMQCTQWIYDTSQLADTITTQWDFVCDHDWKKATISSVYIAGMAVGGFVSAWFADRFGRKKVILVCGMLNVVCALGSTFSIAPWMYYITRFFHAGFLMGSITAMIILANEIVCPAWRVFAGASIFIIWAIGYMLLSGIAYAMRFYSWKSLNLVLILPELIYFVLVFSFVPESARWLYMKGRHVEADEIVIRMARVNKRELPKIWTIIQTKEKTTTTFLDLFKTPKLRMMSFILTFNWAANAFIYYGLSLNTSDLGGNPYINFVISGAVEIPAYVFQIWSFGQLGRIWSYCLSMIIGGIALIISIGIPEDQVTATIALSMIGKFFITATFGMIWTYTQEAFPTCIRTQGVTTCSIGARIASGLSPYIGLLGKVHPSLPPVVYGVSALIGGGLFFLLPETGSRPLPQTIAEGEEAVTKYRIDIRKCCAKKPFYIGVNTDENVLRSININSAAEDQPTVV